MGYLLFGFLFFFSFLGFVSRIQASLLFNFKFAKSLKRGRLLVRPKFSMRSRLLLKFLAMISGALKVYMHVRKCSSKLAYKQSYCSWNVSRSRSLSYCR